MEMVNISERETNVWHHVCLVYKIVNILSRQYSTIELIISELLTNKRRFLNASTYRCYGNHNSFGAEVAKIRVVMTGTGCSQNLMIEVAF